MMSNQHETKLSENIMVMFDKLKVHIFFQEDKCRVLSPKEKTSTHTHTLLLSAIQITFFF